MDKHIHLHILAEFFAGLTDGLAGEDGPQLRSPTSLCQLGFDMGAATREGIESPEGVDDYLGLEVRPLNQVIRSFTVAIIEGLPCTTAGDKCPDDARELTDGS